MQPEQKVKARIKRNMTALAPESWSYMPPGGPYGKAGVPDFVFCVPIEITPEMVGKRVGLFVAMEAKTETGKPTKNQQIQITEIRKAGGVAAVVRPQNMQEIFEALRALFGPATQRMGEPLGVPGGRGSAAQPYA